MINRRSFISSGLAIAFVAPGTFAHAAGDDGLYASVFDPQSSFIRVLAPDQAFAVVGGTRINELDSGLSAYVNVQPGVVSVAHTGGTTDLTVAPATHYTVVLQQGAAPLVLVDDLKLNPAKADVSLYNLSTRDEVDLFVPAARAVALKAVPVAGSKSVALKAPLTLDFDFRVGDETLVSVAAVELKRKAGVSVVLTGGNGQYAAAAVSNTYMR